MVKLHEKKKKKTINVVFIRQKIKERVRADLSGFEYLKLDVRCAVI